MIYLIILGVVLAVILYLLSKYIYVKVKESNEEYWEDFKYTTLGKKLKKPK